MNLRTVIFGEDPSSLQLPSEFSVKLERHTPTDVVHFDARVKGYFTGKSGKPEFVAETILLNGLPDMNIRQFFPDEIKEVRKYALSVELPRILGARLR